jgi:hypothetical protein
MMDAALSAFIRTIFAATAICALLIWAPARAFAKDISGYL